MSECFTSFASSLMTGGDVAAECGLKVTLATCSNSHNEDSADVGSP